MYQFYTGETVEIKADGADLLIIKGVGNIKRQYEANQNKFLIALQQYPAGKYLVQFFKGSKVVKQDNFILKQSLKDVPQDYDFRTNAEKTLEAIEAFLSGTATHQQRKVKCGDKEIEYSSYDELIKWQNHFKTIVRKEQGKPSAIRFEKIYFKGK